MIINKSIAMPLDQPYPELETTHVPENGQPSLSKGERKKLRREEKKRQQEKAAKAGQRKRILKQIALWTPVGAAVLGVGWFIVMAVRSPDAPDLISRRGIHWHPELSLKVKGQAVEIPANIGVGGAVHKDMHTHKVNDQIHVEMNRAVRQDDIRLGKFFAIWGKQFNSRCVVDTCSDTEGLVKMTVNGQPNTQFENYLMQDKDRIEITYD